MCQVLTTLRSTWGAVNHLQSPNVTGVAASICLGQWGSNALVSAGGSGHHMSLRKTDLTAGLRPKVVSQSVSA